jgi:hypothetical protein
MPLPNEVIVVEGHEDMMTPSSCTERDEIEESFEYSRKVLRKPSRFTFDIVPSVSESYEDPEQQTNNYDNIVIKNNVSGLSILDDTQRSEMRTCFATSCKESESTKIPVRTSAIDPATMKKTMAFSGAQPLQERTRTNSTCCTSEISSSSDGSEQHVASTTKIPTATATKVIGRSITPNGMSSGTKMHSGLNDYGRSKTPTGMSSSHAKNNNSSSSNASKDSSWFSFNLFSFFDITTSGGSNLVEL